MTKNNHRKAWKNNEFSLGELRYLSIEREKAALSGAVMLEALLRLLRTFGENGIGHCTLYTFMSCRTSFDDDSRFYLLCRPSSLFSNHSMDTRPLL